MSDIPLNLFGGLTIVPTLGLELMAETVKPLIEAFSERPNNNATPVSVVPFDIGRKRVNGEPIAASVGRGVCQHDVVVLASGPGTPEMIKNLLLTLYHLRSQKAKRITVVFGYFPWSRTERKEKRKKDGLIEYPLPLFLVELIQTAAGKAFGSIVAFDLHADIPIPGDIVQEVSFVKPLLQRAILDNREEETRFHVLSYTDAGAAKRSEEACDKAVSELRAANVPINLKLIHGEKDRLSDQQQKMKRRPSGDVRAVRKSVVYQVDDEAATLGTLETNSRFLIDHYGAKKIIAVVIHSVLCGEAVKFLSAPNSPISCLYTSDTIPLHNRPELQSLIASGKIRVVSIVDELAKIIYYLHWGHEIHRVR